MSIEQQIFLTTNCPPSDLDVVGVDIGIKNLALCRLRLINDRPVVVWWQVIDLLGLEGGIAKDACAALPKALAPYLPCFQSCKVFALEQQPFNNSTMLCLAHGLIAYFHTVIPECTTYMNAAQNKLKPFDVKTETYAERKSSAEMIVAKLLNEAIGDGIEVERHTFFAKWYSSLKKRDDAADSLLHAYHGLMFPYKKKAKTLGTLSIRQLQDQLRQRGLPVSGKKSELRARLRTAQAGEAGRTKLSVKELRAQLAERGLDCSGSKVELAKRLYKS